MKNTLEQTSKEFLNLTILKRFYNRDATILKNACPWCRASFLWMSQKQINLFLDTIGRNSPTVTLRFTLRGLRFLLILYIF